jgi:hypothetical protein
MGPASTLLGIVPRCKTLHVGFFGATACGRGREQISVTLDPHLRYLPSRSVIGWPTLRAARGQGEFGSEMIPLATLAGKPIMVPGGTGAINTMSVAHETGGVRDGVSTDLQ